MNLRGINPFTKKYYAPRMRFHKNASMKNRSRLLVCGAATSTQRSQPGGKLPCVRQPSTRRTQKPRRLRMVGILVGALTLGSALPHLLNAMGGAGVFRIGPRDPNLGVIIETLTRHGAETIMAQRYLPQIKDGDKRILLIDGEVVPYCLARIPAEGETRGNLAAGGTGVARPLDDRDWEIARTLSPQLKADGLLLVGLDVIGDCLTEVNVTSPTCFQEITQQTGFDVAAMFVDAVEKRTKGEA